MRTLIICSFFCIVFGENREFWAAISQYLKILEVLNEEFAGTFLVSLLEKYDGPCPVNRFTSKYHHDILSEKTGVTFVAWIVVVVDKFQWRGELLILRFFKQKSLFWSFY